MNAKIGALLFSFQGRINRAKYWFATGIYILVLLVGAAALLGGFGITFAALFGLVCLGLLVSCWAVGIKRLHDRGKSGWWLLLFFVVPAVLDAADRLLDSNLVLELASFVISLWMIVELGFLRGTPGSNKYGPDPLAL